MMRCLLLCVALALAAACSGGRATSAEAPACARIGDSCRTPEGPLGVCNEAGGPCESPPCLACIPQH